MARSSSRPITSRAPSRLRNGASSTRRRWSPPARVEEAARLGLGSRHSRQASRNTSPVEQEGHGSVSDTRVLLDGIAMGESPRWHEGRLWFSDWGTNEIVAADLDGK